MKSTTICWLEPVGSNRYHREKHASHDQLIDYLIPQRSHENMEEQRQGLC